MERFLNFLKKVVAQGTIELIFSRSNNLFKKYFMVRPISFNFLFKASMFTDKEALKAMLRLTPTSIFEALEDLIFRIFTETVQQILILFSN